MEEKFNQAGFFQEQHHFFDFFRILMFLYSVWENLITDGTYIVSCKFKNAFRNCGLLDLRFEKALGCKIYVSCNFALEAREMQLQLYVVW